MIELQSVTKRYKQKKDWQYVIRDANFRLDKGDSIALLGVKGAGKTTLLKLLCGTERPDGGSVMRTSRVSWPVPLTNCFVNKLSGVMNTRFFARIFEEPASSFVKKVQEMSELGTLINQPLSSLPSYAKAHLAFSIAICMDFDLYLFDENVIVGTRDFKKKCFKLVTYLRRNRGLVIATTKKPLVKAFCNQAFVLDGGALHYHENIREGWRHFTDVLRREPAPSDDNLEDSADDGAEPRDDFDGGI